jgi:hypothetical protein
MSLKFFPKKKVFVNDFFHSFKVLLKETIKELELEKSDLFQKIEFLNKSASSSKPDASQFIHLNNIKLLEVLYFFLFFIFIIL